MHATIAVRVRNLRLLPGRALRGTIYLTHKLEVGQYLTHKLEA